MSGRSHDLAGGRLDGPVNPKRNICQSRAGATAPQHLGGTEDPVTLPLCFQNILSQAEEGSSRQENAQKALSAVSKVGRGKLRREEVGGGGGGREQVAAGMAEPTFLTRSSSAAVLRWGA